MSPILVRPVREQLEHDRVIRLLQAKYKRKFEVAINPGNEQTAPVGPTEAPWYPDLVLLADHRSRPDVTISPDPNEPADDRPRCHHGIVLNRSVMADDASWPELHLIAGHDPASDADSVIHKHAPAKAGPFRNRGRWVYECRKAIGCHTDPRHNPRPHRVTSIAADRVDEALRLAGT